MIYKNHKKKILALEVIDTMIPQLTELLNSLNHFYTNRQYSIHNSHS